MRAVALSVIMSSRQYGKRLRPTLNKATYLNCESSSVSGGNFYQ